MRSRLRLAWSQYFSIVLMHCILYWADAYEPSRYLVLEGLFCREKLRVISPFFFFFPEVSDQDYEKLSNERKTSQMQLKLAIFSNKKKCTQISHKTRYRISQTACGRSCFVECFYPFFMFFFFCCFLQRLKGRFI